MATIVAAHTRRVKIESSISNCDLYCGKYGSLLCLLLKLEQVCTVLYCTVLSCAVLYTVLYFIVLYCLVQYCTLYCTVLYCTVLCSTVHCTVLYCTVLCSTVHCTVLSCAVLYIVLYCLVQYCTLYCTVLVQYCTLYCTVLWSTVDCTVLSCAVLYIVLYCLVQYCTLYCTTVLCSTVHCTVLCLCSTVHCVVKMADDSRAREKGSADDAVAVRRGQSIQCCRCNGNGTCKGCSCVKMRRECTNCTPGKKNRCLNSNVAPSTAVLPPAPNANMMPYRSEPGSTSPTVHPMSLNSPQSDTLVKALVDSSSFLEDVYTLSTLNGRSSTSQLPTVPS